MNRFTVFWNGDALGELAQIWMESEQRDAITAAVQSIDTLLVADPWSKSKALSEGLRKLEVAPL